MKFCGILLCVRYSLREHKYYALSDWTTILRIEKIMFVLITCLCIVVVVVIEAYVDTYICKN